MSTPEPDTPETVREKLRNLPVILNMANHYLVERHDGDFYNCDLCFDKAGEEEPPPF